MLRALLYVPYAVGIGYGIGYGFGDAIQHAVGPLGYVALAAVFALTLVITASRILRARRATH